MVMIHDKKFLGGIFSVLLAEMAYAGITTTNLKQEPGDSSLLHPDGWTYSGVTANYSGGGNKLDSENDFIRTFPYPGSVTSVVFQIKTHPGTSPSRGMNADLSVVADEEPNPRIVFSLYATSTSLQETNLTAFFPETDNIRTLLLRLTRKEIGNIELQSVSVCWSEDSVLSPPSSPRASALSHDGFHATWDEVPGAGGYAFRLCSFTQEGRSDGTMFFSESFANVGAYISGFASFTPDELNDITDVQGWTGCKVFPNNTAIRIGSGEEKGWILSPPITMKEKTGIALTFDASLFSKDEAPDATVDLLTDAGTITNRIALLNLSTLTNSYFFPFSPPPSADARLLFTSGTCKKSCRFTLDNIQLLHGYSPGHRITNWISSTTGNELQATMTNLTHLSTAVYGFQVQSKKLFGTTNEQDSPWSEMIEADLVSEKTPPTLEIPSPKDAWAGELLSVPLSVTKTDCDTLLSTGIVTEAKGECSLSLLHDEEETSTYLFTYLPSVSDTGRQTFVLSVTDKDGSGQVELSVLVHPPCTTCLSLTLSPRRYFQDFNSLTNFQCQVKKAGWHNFSLPLEGWQAYIRSSPIDSVNVWTNNSPGGGFYAWYRDSQPDNFALGSNATEDFSDLQFGCAFSNATGIALKTLSTSFTAIQWFASSSNEQSLVFQVCVTNRWAPLTEIPKEQWSSVCVFSSPVLLAPGELKHTVYASERKEISLPFELSPDEIIILRWTDQDDESMDHCFAIDDVEVNWMKKAEAGTVVTIE